MLEKTNAISHKIQSRFSRRDALSKVGKTVAPLIEFSGVPKGNRRKVIGTHRTGVNPTEWDVKIQWELPGKTKLLVD